MKLTQIDPHQAAELFRDIPLLDSLHLYDSSGHIHPYNVPRDHAVALLRGASSVLRLDHGGNTELITPTQVVTPTAIYPIEILQDPAFQAAA